MAHIRNAVSSETRYEQLVHDVLNLKNDMAVVRQIISEQNKMIDILTPRQTPRKSPGEEYEEEKEEKEKEEKEKEEKEKENKMIPRILLSCAVGLAAVGITYFARTK